MPKSSKPFSTPLSGKVALITGASRGIGLAIARSLAERGCHLIVAGRSASALKEAGRELVRGRIRVVTQACDVRDPESVKALAAAARKQFRRVDILINNAGITQPNIPVDELDYQTWKDVIDTNLNGMFLVTHEILALMRRGGTIVNNLSLAATRVFAGLSAYDASKYGALGFTDTLREELRPKGIRVIALIPGATDTEIWNTLWPDAPRKKMMSPETVASALVSALSLPENSTVEEIKLQPTSGTL
jgi:NAD(P)-dependent dehydrogenase (short-subunit alcohol dehydrogenase family)